MKRTGKTLPLILAFVFTLAFMPLDALAKGGGFSGGGRSFGGSGFGSGSRSFSSPSRSFSAPSAPRSYSTPSAPPSYSTPSAPKSFSSPSIPQTKPQPALPSAPNTQYDRGAGRAARKDLSQQKFDTANPKPSPTPDYHDARVRDLRRDLSYERMQNRELRQQQTFGGYAGRPTPCCYSDPFGNMFFWLWLSDRPRHDRDAWVYNHRDEMDPARYEELRRKDSDLDRRLKELESQGVKKDPSYVPPGVDRDLMYSDDHVKQAYKEAHTSRFPWGWVFGIVIILGLAYLFFFVRFNVRKR